jgi:hypothetical protein
MPLYRGVILIGTFLFLSVLCSPSSTQSCQSFCTSHMQSLTSLLAYAYNISCFRDCQIAGHLLSVVTCTRSKNGIIR